MTNVSPYAIFADRTHPVVWASQMAQNPTTVVLDTETTGLGVDAEIVEIAIVAIDGRTLLNTLVRPTSRSWHQY
jgi:DNA polymerase-3 subunit epsilon